MVVNQEGTGLCFSLSTTDGVTTRYAYDAAGRMVREGNKRYTYGYLDKVMSVTDGDTTRTFTYHADGQLASANYGDTSESFAWDGLALIQRGDEQFVNEPHVGGGNPVASSKGTSYFNDALGTTVGAKKDGKYSAAVLSAFGENLSVDSPTPTQNSNFFTGKPMVEGLGHTFLMRNYRAGLAKWQNADPMGYPDGWNQLAYGINSPMEGFDLRGGDWYEWNSGTMLAYYIAPWGPNHLDIDVMGFTDGIYDVIMTNVLPRFRLSILNTVLPIIVGQQSHTGNGKVTVILPSKFRYYNFSSVCWALGDGSVFMDGYANYYWCDRWVDGHLYRYYEITTDFTVRYYDIFKDPLSQEHQGQEAIEFGTPYSYEHIWSNQEIYQHGRMLLE